MTQNSFGIGGQTPGPDIKRLLLAVVLMTGVLMSYNAFFAPRIAPGQEPQSATEIVKAPKVSDEVKVISAAPGIVPTASDISLVTKEFSMSMPHVSGSEASLA